MNSEHLTQLNNKHKIHNYPTFIFSRDQGGVESWGVIIVPLRLIRCIKDFIYTMYTFALSIWLNFNSKRAENLIFDEW